MPSHAVNRTLPVFTAPNLDNEIPALPSTQQIRALHLFAEPLIPAGTAPSDADNQQLAAALRQNSQRDVADDFSALQDFVSSHPASPWTGSLEFNLAMEYYRSGWYSKALDSFEGAWSALQSATNPAAMAIANRAAGELAVIYARLGRIQPLTNLLESITHREISGSSSRKIAEAKEALWMMEHRPEAAYRCGPVALDRISLFQSHGKARNSLMRELKSATNGFSLSQVCDQSRRMGMNFQMAFRTKGSTFILPALVHWKAGHYAALLRKENGLYLVQDPAMHNRNVWVSSQALDAEASGYFLTPAGNLPDGWRSVATAEGDGVWGGNEVSTIDPNATTPEDKKPCECPAPYPCHGGAGMTVADVQLMAISLNLVDSPVGYTPPIGPSMRLELNYDQYEAAQPAVFNYSNLGPLWTFNWLAFITDDPSSPSADVDYYTDGGGTLPFNGFDTNTQSFAPQLQSQAILTRTSPDSYSMTFANGAQFIFGLATPANGTTRQVFMTQVIDPHGNAVKISYDSSFRIVGVTDPLGQVTVFSYGDPGDPLKITRVTDPFGRFATLQYNVSGQLEQITDCIGLTSQFTYDAGGSVIVLTTPYGTTQFTFSESANGNGPDRSLVITYPNMDKERFEFSDSSGVGLANSVPLATIPSGINFENEDLYDRNTYYWDRNAYPAYAANTNNYTTAHIYHWLHGTDFTSAAGVMESEKSALENRIWYNYPDQPDPITVGSSSMPTAVARVLDDGTTQLYSFGYDVMGNATNMVDPVGRSTTFVYSTNFQDPLEIRQTTGTNNDLVGRFLYNSQHEPVAEWSATGGLTTNIYNSFGELLTTTDPLGETWTFTYDTNGYLLAVTGPIAGTNDTTSYAYDYAGRVARVTCSDGFTFGYSYDNFDRVTNIAFPDGTFEAFAYDKLDKVMSQDRLGRQTFFTYDPLRQMVSMQDPLNRVTRFEYCGCGEVSAMVDPLGRQTTWDHDLEGRLIARQAADGSRAQYNYENTTSRLKSVVDEIGQITLCDYFPDNSLQSVSYPNAATPTPTVTFGYDGTYGRRVSMQDGIGTTTWSYYPVGGPGALQIAGVTGPWATVTFQYDALNRMTGRTVGGLPETFSFDPMSRLTNAVNALGSFAYDYDGATSRMLDAYYPNGQATHYQYFDNSGDRRLRQLTHQAPNSSILSQFTYGYNSFGEMTNWTQQLGAATQAWDLSYDSADQLLGVIQTQNGSVNANYSYVYDTAANVVSANSNSAQQNFQYDALNQLQFTTNLPSTNAVYQWDAEHRLTAIIQGSNESRFFYDGFGRRARILELSNGVTQADRRFVWSSGEIGEELNSNNIVVNRYFDQGEQQGGTNLFYTRDHLGSIRELTDNTGAIRAQYAYSPFGQTTKLIGNLDANFGFTGDFRHLPSALDLTTYRAYDPSVGRWLSRDPLGASAGVNVYEYVQNNPIGRVDHSGLDDGPGDSTPSAEPGPPPPPPPVPNPVYPPIVITEQEFQSEVDKMQNRLGMQSLNESFLQQLRNWDSKWHSDNLQAAGFNPEQQIFCFRGHALFGHELNYYFTGMLVKEYGYSEEDLFTIMNTWKFVEYLQSPSANTIWAGVQGYQNSPNYIPPDPTAEAIAAYRAAHPGK